MPTAAATLVQELLDLCGLGKSAFARSAGISRSLLDDYLKGRTQPTLAQLQRLGDAVGLVLESSWRAGGAVGVVTRWEIEPGTTPSDYLGGDDVVAIDDPDVRTLGELLRREHPDDVDFAAAAFAWVRDEVRHSFDAGIGTVTVTAGDVLRERLGLCYAKSHLLAAVLRGQGIPTALCYQRLRDGDLGEDGFVVHGLVAVHLGGSWHRQDPRGNKPGVDARFSLAEERLAWPVDPASGECDYVRLHRAPAPAVLDALRAADDLLTCSLPSGLDGSGPA